MKKTLLVGAIGIAAVGTVLVSHMSGLGVANSAITQQNIDQTICNPNWHGINPYTHKDVKGTGQIRPPVSYTNPIKQKLMKAQGVTDGTLFELDHRIALTDGGDPSNEGNLWLQPYTNLTSRGNEGAHEKDKLEVYINTQICAKRITLQEGQNELKGDWFSYYQKYGLQRIVGSMSNDADDL